MNNRVIVSVGLTAVLLSGVYVSYQRDIQQARARVSVGSTLLDTPGGPIEYAVAGQGFPVLIAHGAGGGFDQALDVAEPAVEGGLRVIAPARFGYLRAAIGADGGAHAYHRDRGRPVWNLRWRQIHR